MGSENMLIIVFFTLMWSTFQVVPAPTTLEPSSSQPRIETTLSRTITSQSKLLTRRSPSVTLRNNAQTTCRDLQYRCQNGRCIFHTYQCDGDDDCGDYSDEVHCAYQRRVHSGTLQNNVTDEPVAKCKVHTGTIAGAITGELIFITIAVVVALLVQRKILRNRHIKSVKELYTLHFSRNRAPKEDNLLPKKQALQPESKQDDEDLVLPYIVLLEDWDVATEKLKLLDKKLGEGQFGIVKQGLLTTEKDDPEIVAAKMLKDGARESDHQDLTAELTILKKINKIPHANVIRLIGGCSIQGKLHIITEFCSAGNLRNVLINSRVNPPDNSPDNMKMTSTLNYRELLKIAVDVTSGMTHLTDQKLVHRDLAARNILLGDDNTAKISDFGLARDIGDAKEYVRNTHNLLPIKWLALESMLYGKFTTASDVWSYGILLHEIITLGEEPYKAISPLQVAVRVGCGYRMSQPPQCSEELYRIMARCWNVDSKERPTFVEIHELLHDMLIDNEKSYIYVTQINTMINGCNDEAKDGKKYEKQSDQFLSYEPSENLENCV